MSTARQPPATYSVPPVERAVKLLQYIAAGNPCRNLSAAAADLEINRTTLMRLLHTLTEHRMVEEIAEGGGYGLGVGLISLGAQAIEERNIVRICQPILAALCARTGMSAHLGVLDGTEIVYLGRETPNTHLVSNVRAGSRLPAQAASIGRVILAEMEPEALTRLFAAAPLNAVTDKTPLTLEAILAQAREDRAAGFAWSEGNFESGIGSCAAVILDHRGAPAGGINVSGPQEAFAREARDGGDAIRTAVLQAARDASLALGFTGGEAGAGQGQRAHGWGLPERSS